MKNTLEKKLFRNAKPIDESRWGITTERIVSIVSLVVTLALCIVVARNEYYLLQKADVNQSFFSFITHIIFITIILVLIYGSFVYQLTRLGYVNRRANHVQVPRADLDVVFNQKDAKRLTVLVPSYREERRTILQTMLSAALQEYPNRRVVLLIDDPQKPSNPHEQTMLADAREIPSHIDAAFRRPLQRIRAQYGLYQHRNSRDCTAVSETSARIIDLYEYAAKSVNELISLVDVQDHVDQFFIDNIISTKAAAISRRSNDFRRLVSGNDVTAEHVEFHFRYLLAIFDVEVASFERKRYVNLSHEPNKAMNLNSYIALVGKRWAEKVVDDGIYLVETVGDEQYHFDIPSTDFYITLDADSMILPDYAIRLAHEMEKPTNQRMAVIQTPYSSFPGTTNSLERVAGATTDIQYIIHQGFTRYNATYWVGANALLRAQALEDIVTNDAERGYTIKRYIQDRTVIEDTESTIDLVAKGWTLYNYPERLAYSATPPDYGSLLIQRRRWSNGGLIILPKMLRYFAANIFSPKVWAESFFRIHYLVSIALVNVGLLLLLAFPFQELETSPLIPLTALPYFFMYTRDLVLCGYRVSDIFRVYALNLVLIPVHLGGVLKSLQQSITRKKIPFGRTPKVNGRTAAPALYVTVTFLLLINWYVGMTGDLYDHLWAHAIFSLINATFLLLGIRAYMGFSESWQDVKVIFPRKAISTSPSSDARGIVLESND